MVPTPEELRQAYPLAVSESGAAFGDGAVYMEKYIHPAHHIEVQILADETGSVVCLGSAIAPSSGGIRSSSKNPRRPRWAPTRGGS